MKMKKLSTVHYPLVTLLGLGIILLTTGMNGGCARVNDVAPLSSGATTLSDVDFGFDFSENKILSANSGNADFILIPVTGEDEKSGEIIITSMAIFVSSNKGCKIRDLGEVELNAVSSVPTNGYSSTEVYVIPEVSHLYVVKTNEGNFAKMYVTSFSSSEGHLAFSWVYQPDGSGNF